MNVERLEQLADHVEQLSFGTEAGKFTMKDWEHSCGAPACLAGWAILLFGDEGSDYEFVDDDPERPRLGLLDDHVSVRAAELLDLPTSVWTFLFEPRQRDFDLIEIDPQWAARCVRNLIESGGIVDWNGTRTPDHES